MSEGEILIFIVSLLCSFTLCLSWIHQHTGLGADGYPRPRQTMALVAPILCAGVLFIILKTRASADVRDSSLFLAFYMMMGTAWVGFAMRTTGLAGITVRDDVVERRNGAASLALAGAMIGLTFAFAGGNVGDGPGWWVVVFSAGLATLFFFALWIALDSFAHIGDAITIDRDDASAMRLAGFLIAEGSILGRAVAGNWVSAMATIRDFVNAGWPSLVLLVFAVVVERVCCPNVRRPRPDLATFGFIPAAAYVIAAGVVVVRLEGTT